MTPSRLLVSLLVATSLAFLGSCATTPTAPAKPLPSGAGVLRSVPMDAALEDRILALDPKKITAADIRDTLSKAPAPRVFTIRGGIYPVYLAMESFGDFLIGMGSTVSTSSPAPLSPASRRRRPCTCPKPRRSSAITFRAGPCFPRRCS